MSKINQKYLAIFYIFNRNINPRKCKPCLLVTCSLSKSLKICKRKIFDHGSNKRQRPSEKHQAIWDLPINQLEEPERDTTLKIPNKILAEDVKRKVESVLIMRNEDGV